MLPSLDHQSGSAQLSAGSQLVSVHSVDPVVCFLFVFVPLHFVKLCLPFLAVFFTLSFALALAFALSRLPVALAFVLFCLCPCQACLWFYRPCQTIHSFGSFACVQFSFDNLSPCDRKFHTMKFRPLPTNPSEQAECFFVPIQRVRSPSQISFILSCQQ